MFKNEYQGGPFVEIFSAQGKNPGAKWKIFGSPSVIWKEFDKEVKSFVFVLEGSSQTNKIQLPKENKQILGLIQRFLVLQIYVPLGQDFSTELLITDLGNIKRRLYLSTVHKELSATPLHAKIPLFMIKRKIWCNLCIDLVAFTSDIFKGAVFQSLDGIIVSANCKLRKIFTLKSKPRDTADRDDIYGAPFTAEEPTEIIPRSCQLTTDVPQVTQLLNMTKLRQTEMKFGGQPLASTEPDQFINRGSGTARNSKNQDVSHIAFGSKVLGPPPPSGRKHSMRTSAENVRSRSSRTCQQPTIEKGTNKSEVSSLQFYESEEQGDKENIHLEKQITPFNADLHIMHPHPPQEPSADKNNSRRRLRLKSTSKDRTETPSGSSSGNSRNEDMTPAKLTTVSHQRINCPVTLDVSSHQHQSPHQIESDEWVFPENYRDHFHLDSSKQSIPLEDDSCNDSHQLPENCKESENSIEGEEAQSAPNEIFTFSSRPRSVPHGRCPTMFPEVRPFLLDLKEEDDIGKRRGAQLEDDFCGGDSNEEANQSLFTHDTPGLPVSLSTSGLCEFTVSSELLLERMRRKAGSRTHQGYVKSACVGTAAAETWSNVQKDLEPTLCLSPTLRRPDLLKETPSSSTKLKDLPVCHQLTAPLNETSLKEIPVENAGPITDTPDYDWTNYQPSQMSESELQMLASMRRQQIEELEDTGVSHGLSASQVDNCNVSISSSSDDTTTWNSCLPPPVNQGRHYQKEMDPPSPSNPRDWLNVFSPPIVPPSQQPTELLDSSGSLSVQGEDDLSADEDEEVLTLLYDPCLNCYFDPQTGKYYELA
ncbi:protein CFAP20DC isoform X2 [Monodelphis domestica]|uniref:protein CFAP20DC isoform X2 n=1 Tax=Monodelphis domestica TaxID=13616 RepID=UPI0024E1A3E8|nr:protein CFAP20DC isoform X2 [Monodelphis domestica]